MPAILIRLNEKDFEQVKAEAEKLNLSVAAFVRLLIKQWGDGIKFERR